MDAETPAVDNWNEVGCPVRGPGRYRWHQVGAGCSHRRSVNRRSTRLGSPSWKSYQESLPFGSISGVNYSNGTATNLTDFTNLAPLTSSSIVQDYAVKHNPFAYFKSVQDGDQDNNSLANVVGFDGPRGLYTDLANGDLPALSFIVPNQCNDQHGRGNSDAFCAFDYGQNDSG